MTDELPANLAKPRRVRTGVIPGVVIGLAMLALDIALLVYALTTWS